MRDFLSAPETPLLLLTDQDVFTINDAFQGVHMFGGIGSGKTSGSGRALASAYLRAGFGGLVLAAKPDEVELWWNYAQANGRANSVVLFGDRGDARFNFIDYELARHGTRGLGSVIECLMRVVDAARTANPDGGRADDAFWQNTTRQLLRNTVPVLYAATGTVRIPDIIRFIATAPTSITGADEKWQASSFMFAMTTRAEAAPNRLPPHELAQIIDYWLEEYANLDGRTRSNIAISVSTALDRFNRGRLHEAFCTSTNIVPEMCFHGAIILMDMSALTWNEDGIIAQQLFKFIWQRAVLARNALSTEHRERPVFLWADESQYFVNAFDAEYQSTCRQSKAATVYLTQSLPTYYAKLGGDNPKAKADMLLANFVTKIFHSNADPETNRWAADTIGRIIQRRANYSEGSNYGTSHGMNAGEGRNWGGGTSFGSSRDAQGNISTSSSSSTNAGASDNWGRNVGTSSGGSVSGGYNENMDYEIEPGDFGRYLKTGGSANQGQVTAVWYQAGKTFEASGGNYVVARFQQ